MWLSLQKLEMTDFMEKDVKFTLWTRETELHKVLDIFCYFVDVQGLQQLTKIITMLTINFYSNRYQP